MEEEESRGQNVSYNDTSDADDSFDDMFTENLEDSQWLQKVKLVMTSKHTERLEAKVRNIKLYGSSFHCLKPKSWITDEVIDAYLSCVVEKADGKVEAISAVVSTVILSGRATQMKVKSELLQNDILLLPYHTPGHWVIAIALMEKKELLIIDPLCDEIRYERTCLRNWRNFIKRLTSKSSSDWNSKIVPHPRQSDGHNCGPLILKFAETYLQHKDFSLGRNNPRGYYCI
ncbi:putative ubiquitin-like-specific protease 1B [Mauremys reevesii]|uniref:putative ubiquitin-like-specific protease 1B n=1 Tax=Mauremys reevesii TaxID=260615 RepID=UPI00193F9958|nr:putative ubiquitin-like-specific protease 1B [Mauremys reevesii]